MAAAILVSTVTALIVAALCVAVTVQEIRLANRRARRRRTKAQRCRPERLAAPIREHAQARGVDIEDLLILCGAEGWSDGEPH